MLLPHEAVFYYHIKNGFISVVIDSELKSVHAEPLLDCLVIVYPRSNINSLPVLLDSVYLRNFSSYKDMYPTIQSIRLFKPRLIVMNNYDKSGDSDGMMKFGIKYNVMSLTATDEYKQLYHYSADTGSVILERQEL